MTIKGFAAPEVQQAYNRALELCRQVGETPQLLPVLKDLQAFYVARAEFRTAHELAEQIFTLAQRLQDPALLIAAHAGLGVCLSGLGEPVRAREHFEQGRALYDPQQHRSLVFLYGQDYGVYCHGVGAIALWQLGYVDQALKRACEALTLACKLSHPYTLAYDLFHAAMSYQFRREAQAVQELTEAVMTLSTEHGFALLLAWATIYQGWGLAEQGEVEGGVAQVRQGLAALRATGARVTWPNCLALLAEAYEKAGQVEEGLGVLAEALDTVNKTEERVWEAELYRLKGELTLAQSSVLSPESGVKEAEECFRKAIDIARRQSAKSLELRATMSLARLWQQQGKKKQARKMLAEIYGWFTEGFDTKDLQEAKALLEELR